MANPQYKLFAKVAVCVIGLATAAALKSQPASPSDFGPPIPWIAVNADSASRDRKILDVVLRDALTNRELASARKFYGGELNRSARLIGFPLGYPPTVADYLVTVRYTGFPAGYQPNVADHVFELLSATNLGSGLKLTVALGGLWVDQPPPKEAQDDFRVLRPPGPVQRGVLLSFYNSGRPTTNGTLITSTMGACMFGYEIRQTTNGWEVGLLGYVDP